MRDVIKQALVAVISHQLRNFKALSLDEESLEIEDIKEGDYWVKVSFRFDIRVNPFITHGEVDVVLRCRGNVYMNKEGIRGNEAIQMENLHWDVYSCEKSRSEAEGGD